MLVAGNIVAVAVVVDIVVAAAAADNCEGKRRKETERQEKEKEEMDTEETKRVGKRRKESLNACVTSSLAFALAFALTLVLAAGNCEEGGRKEHMEKNEVENYSHFYLPLLLSPCLSLSLSLFLSHQYCCMKSSSHQTLSSFSLSLSPSPLS